MFSLVQLVDCTCWDAVSSNRPCLELPEMACTLDNRRVSALPTGADTGSQKDTTHC